MNKYFVILGGNMLLQGVHDKLKEYGYNVIVVDWNDNPAVKGDLHLQIDVKDSDRVIEALKNTGFKIDGCVTCIDLAVPTQNRINKWCGNYVMPDKFLQVLTKEEMRKCWEKAGLFNRISKTDDELSIERIYEISRKYKLVIKPNIAASSRGITILEKGQEIDTLLKALQLAKDCSFDKHCLIEEFIEAEEFTVDMLGDAYGNVCVYGSSIAYQSPNAKDNHIGTKYHYNSTKYTKEVWDKIAAFGIACYKATGLNTSFGHLEIFMKKDGSLMPVEMGARSSGFICSHLVSAASGHDFLGDFIRVLHGGKIESGHYLCGDTSSMWFGYDIPGNTCSVKESNLSFFLDPRIKIIYSKRTGLVANKHFDLMINDNDRDNLGYEMLVGPRDVLTIENVEKAEQAFLIDYLDNKK